MAQYKCLPMYEYIRPGIYVLFNQNGDYMTSDPKVIEALDACAPFVERVDKAEPQVEEAESAEDETVEPTQESAEADKPKGKRK